MFIAVFAKVIQCVSARKRPFAERYYIRLIDVVSVWLHIELIN